MEQSTEHSETYAVSTPSVYFKKSFGDIAQSAGCDKGQDRGSSFLDIRVRRILHTRGNANIEERGFHVSAIAK